MPDAYSPWVDAAQSFGGLGPALNNIAVGLANQRMMEQKFFQEMELEKERLGLQRDLYRRHGDLYGARTDLARQQAGDLDAAATARRDLGAGLEVLPRQLGEVPMYPDMLPDEEFAAQQNLDQTIGQVLSSIGRLPAASSTGLGEKIAQMMAIRDPVQAMILAQGGAGKLGVTVPSGATHVPAVPGMPKVTGSANIPQGNVRIPATVDGVPQGSQVSGVPPRAAGGLDLNRALASSQALYGAIIDAAGTTPQPNNPAYPLFQQTTNQLNLISQLMGKELQGRLGTNTPPAAAPPAAAPTGPMNLPARSDFRDGFGFAPRQDLLQRVPLPMPTDKAALQVGELYNTKLGPAIWDGQDFVQPQQIPTR